MPEFIYKLAITAKNIGTDSYFISTDEYYLPSIKSCLDAVYAYEGIGNSVIIVDIEIKRIKVIDDAAI